MTTATVVKRSPGRPKGSKNKPKTTDTATMSTATATVPVAKRGPGRPRKNPVAEMATVPVVKRGPGRPRKNPVAETATVPVAKRGPGRPRKNPVAEAPVVKRGPGRPRKNPVAEAPVVKRGPGRPRKNPEAVGPVVKRGPGRPRKNPEATVANVVKRGPGRPRKNPEAVMPVTVTSTSRTISKSGGNTRQVLVNPFKAGDTVNIPSGSVFTSSAPTLRGRQKVKRGHKVTVIDIIPAHVQPRNSETGSKVLIRPSRIRAKGSGNYWKDITLTEKILKFNGMNATYETVNVETVIVESQPEAEPAVSGIDVLIPTEEKSNAEEESNVAEDRVPMFSEEM